jgi:formylglycine-generating enzyme required for sulfatase activity
METFKDADFTPEMVVVPAGEFWMGSKDGEGYDSERPRHKVTIPKPFAVGCYAVTFDEWDAAVAAGGVTYKPSDQGWGRGRRPVINVNWNDAHAYIEWLSSKTGKRYRLLSETEWEYCCRAGTPPPYSFGGKESDLDRYAWYSANSGYKTHPVGEKLPNEWGLHDMHGNVWEWCEDWWHGDYHNAPGDGSAWTTPGSGYRVLRGGSWLYSPQVLRAARRSDITPDFRINNIGFRVAAGW